MNSGGLAGHDEDPEVLSTGAVPFDRYDFHALAGYGRLQRRGVKVQHVGSFADRAHQGQSKVTNRQAQLIDAGRFGNQ